jgi:uncharacterized damage-inducible protein DinB
MDATAADTGLVGLLAYKRWANAELAALGASGRDQLPADDWTLFVRILNHTHVVDRIFQGHLSGQPHGYGATNTPETPDMAALTEAMRQADDWYVRLAGQISPAQLAEPVQFTFTDGQPGCMSRHEILLHVGIHGTYHRGAAGRILAQHGIQPPRDSITVFLHQSEPQRRQY